MINYLKHTSFENLFVTENSRDKKMRKQIVYHMTRIKKKVDCQMDYNFKKVSTVTVIQNPGFRRF